MSNKKEKIIEFNCDKNEVREIGERYDNGTKTYQFATVRILLSKIISKILPDLWEIKQKHRIDSAEVLLEVLEEKYSKEK